jgi:hypothetical protein
LCVTLSEAELSSTTLVLTATTHPKTGQPVHSLLYQNTVQNLSAGPTAMLLHFPAIEAMDQGNCIPTDEFPECVADIRKAIEPPAISKGFRSAERSMDLSEPVHVFDVGIYTVVLSKSIDAIPQALERVRPDRRPALNPTIFAWYKAHFPGWSFALCCFNNRQAAQASPLLFWYYPPPASDRVMLPGIDAHTGHAPDLLDLVDVDHTIVLGSDKPRIGLAKVRYSDSIPAYERAFLPSYVIGRHQKGRRQNGDFIVSMKTLETGTLEIARGLL